MLKRIYRSFIHVLALYGIYALVSPRFRSNRSSEQPQPVATAEEEHKVDSTYLMLKPFRRDPFLRLLKGGLNLSNISAIGLILVFVAVCNLAIGFVASTFYQGSGQTIHDREYQMFLLGFDFIVTPTILYLYLWQPQAIARVFKGLEQNKAIGNVKTNAPHGIESYVEYRTRIQASMDRWLWAVVPIVGIVGLFSVEWLVVWPIEFAQLGDESYWFAIKWYLPIHLLSSLPAAYALCMFVLREVLAAVYFNRLFQWFEIHLHPMHPDDSGGLGPLGAFTAKSTLAAVVLGSLTMLMVALITFLTRQTWSQTFLRSDILIFLGVYIVLVPAGLILPMWSAHRAMVTTRDSELQRVAQEVERLLQESQQNLQNPDILEATMSTVSRLRSQYEAILEIYPTWPISMQIFRNVSITATLPVLSGLVPVVIRLVFGD